jgi:hypothetical protein
MQNTLAFGISLDVDSIVRIMLAAAAGRYLCGPL